MMKSRPLTSLDILDLLPQPLELGLDLNDELRHQRAIGLRADSVDLAIHFLQQEVVRVAQRSDISEEVTRFQGHLAHWDDLTGGAEPCGRKLDFLLQEMNREVNTIGSKADGTMVSELVIQVKAELERLREQVQNVE